MSEKLLTPEHIRKLAAFDDLVAALEKLHELAGELWAKNEDILSDLGADMGAIAEAALAKARGEV